jgi:cell wall-associated NlpC family hydrolase
MRAFLSMLVFASCVFASAAQAQFRLSDINLRDVERAVRIARAVSDMTRGSRTSPGPTKSPSRTSTTSRTKVSSAAATAALRTGDQYLGVPYVWGGSTPNGFDCSGFVQYVYRKQGVELPRTSRQMAGAGRSIPPFIDALEPGDLMLFEGSNGVISHVAMYAGDGRILHSSSSGNGVRYDDLSTKRGQYYVDHLVVARRVAENGRSLVQSLSYISKKTPFDYFDPPDLAPRVRK